MSKTKAVYEKLSVALRPSDVGALSLALIFAELPLARTVPLWAGIVFWVCGVFRIYLAFTRQKTPGRLLRTAFLIAGVGVTFLLYHTIFGLRPGLALLFVLLAAKWLEMNSATAYAVLACVGYFFAFVGLLISQSFLMCLHVSVSLLLLTAVLLHFHRQERGISFRPGVFLRGAIGLVLRAAPIAVLLFLVFPRANLQFLVPSSAFATGTGLPDHMRPGEVAKIAGTSDLVMQVEFPDGNRPAMKDLYWRAYILWDCQAGLNWERGTMVFGQFEQFALTDKPLNQRIILEPTQAHYLLSLDYPTEAPWGSVLMSGLTIHAFSPIDSRKSYEVASRGALRETPPDPRALQIPDYVSPRVIDLARQIKGAGRSNAEIAVAGLEYFKDHGFVYSLEPGVYDSEDAVGDFLLDRKRGFCEHYAGSYALLMRLAGVPARVVMGYQGGEINAVGGFLSVSQYDAHSWVEIWLASRGWIRVDPTSMAVPERISRGMREFMSAHPKDMPQRMPTWHGNGRLTGAFGQRAALYWDYFNHRWNSAMLGYDADSQRELFQGLGFNPRRRGLVFFGTLGVIVVVLAAITIFLRLRQARPAEEILRIYRKFCRRLAKAGVVRRANEGPLDFGRRAAEALPHEAGPIGLIVTTYVDARYGRIAEELAVLRRRVRAFRPRRSGVK